MRGTPSLVTRLVSLVILIGVALVAFWVLKVVVNLVLFLLGCAVVLGVVLWVAALLRKAGRL